MNIISEHLHALDSCIRQIKRSIDLMDNRSSVFVWTQHLIHLENLRDQLLLEFSPHAFN